jgi:hypothetical protein
LGRDGIGVKLGSQVAFGYARVRQHRANVAQRDMQLITVNERLDFKEVPVDLRHPHQRGQYCA